MLADDILDGKHDSELDDLYNAVIARRKVQCTVRQMVMISKMKKGDRVRIGTSIRPKYMAGITATVEKVMQKNVSIVMDRTAGRFGTRVTCPVSCLELI